MNLLQTLTLVTALVAGTMVGNELAVAAFFHPTLYRLTDDAHARAAKVLAASLGSVMPFWYALTLVLLSVLAWQMHSLNGFAFRAVCSAAFVMAVVIVFTIVYLVPINNRISTLNVEALPDGWKADRAKWDAGHRVRCAALVIVFALLLTSVVVLLPHV